MITKTLTIHCDHSECADADGYETGVSTNAEARQEAGRYDCQERCLVKTLAYIASLLVTPTADLDY